MPKGPWVAAALLAAAGGCARCGGPREPPPERWLPGDASLAVLIPRLRLAQEQAAPLLRTVLSFPAAADQGERVAAVRGQLGLDPLDPGALVEAGLDPERGAGLAHAPGQPPLLVLPVRDPGRLEAAVARLARDRLGAARRGTAQAGGAAVITFAAGEGAPPALALHAVGGAAFLAAGAGGPACVAAAAARPEASALAASPAYGAARSLLGPEQAVVAFAPAGSPALPPGALWRDGAALGAAASGSHLALRAGLLLAPARRAYWQEVLGASAAAGAEAAARLPPAAFLAGRLGGDVGRLAGRLLPLLPPAAASALAGAGVDPRADLLDELAPGAAAAIALAPTFDVGTASRGPADLAGSDVFRLVHLAALLEVRDPARAAAALEKLARAAPRLGLTAAPRPGPGGLPGWRVGFGASALDLALDGRRLAIAGGAGQLEALLGGGARYRGPTEAARAALARGGGGLVLDLGQLVKSFRALPASAYGTGPDAFVMRSLAERLVDPASRLAAVSARLELAEGGARVDLVVEARPAEAASR